MKYHIIIKLMTRNNIPYRKDIFYDRKYTGYGAG